MKHVEFCKTGQPSIEMPLEDNTLKFRNHKFKMPNPVTIYADFEAYNVQVDETVSSNTKLVCEQRPTGFGYIVVSPYEQFAKPVFVYRGEDAAEYFVERLLMECSEVESYLKDVKPMEFTASDEQRFLNSVNCSICEEELDWENETICRDHCHITGRFRFVFISNLQYYLFKPSFVDIGHYSSLNPPNKFSHLRGAAHDICNLKMQQQKRVIVFFHNAKGYDNHFIIKSLASNPHVGEIDVLGQTSEKYTKMSTSRFIIQDSMSHLIGSLDSLSASLRQRGCDGFALVRDEFPDDRQFECCLRKLVYPYDYIDDFQKFNEEIPAIEAFYNKLNDEELALEEYKRLIETCRLFNITTLGQLHDLYLKIDVLILACVFEDYRRLGLEIFQLDPCYYVSSPSYSFDAMLWVTKVKLELLTDKEMYSFFEKGKQIRNNLLIF